VLWLLCLDYLITQSDPHWIIIRTTGCEKEESALLLLLLICWKEPAHLLIRRQNMYTAQPGFNELEGRPEFTMLNCFFNIWSVVVFTNSAQGAWRLKRIKRKTPSLNFLLFQKISGNKGKFQDINVITLPLTIPPMKYFVVWLITCRITYLLKK
jgi:hypothetical protein